MEQIQNEIKRQVPQYDVNKILNKMLGKTEKTEA